jgi:LysR family transcriptional regulator, nitrogen assimilation regulatory protein
LTEGYSGHVHEWLLSGRIDIGVLYHQPQRRTDHEFHKLATEQLCLLGSPAVIEHHLGLSASVAFADTLKLPLILPARPHAIRRLVDEIAASKNTELNLATEVNAFMAVRDLVVAGHGVTILPVSNVLAELASGRLKAINIKDPVLSQTVSLTTSTHHMPSLAATTVARVIRDLAREMVDTAAWPQRHDVSVVDRRRAAR